MPMPTDFPSEQAPLRVLFICHDGDLYGSQQSLLLLLTHLPKECVQPFVSVARPGPLLERLESIDGVTVFCPHKRLQWIKHDRRSFSQHLGDILALGMGATSKVKGLAKLIQQHRIQLVHTNSVVSLEGALAAKHCGIPHIWHIRELFKEPTPKLQPTLGRTRTRNWVSGLSNKIICISKAVQQQFEPEASLNPTKFPVIYNALSPHIQRHSSNTETPLPPQVAKFRLGYIGRLSEGKRIHDLFEAMALIEAQHPGLVEVVVCGNFVDAPYEERIHHLIQEKQLEQKVHLLGYRAELAPIYENIQALVVPSLNEPFGRVVIEAAQAGVPSLAANSGGIPEIVDHGVTGLLFPPENPAAMAECLLEALESPSLLEALSENARQQIPSRFSVERQVDSVMHCYRSVMQQPQK